MIRFPETALNEWRRVAEAAEKPQRLADKVQHELEVETAVKRLRVRHEATQQFQQELDTEATPTLEMGTMADLLNAAALTPPTDLIDGVVKDSGVCLVLGPSGSGKSTLAMQMIHSLTSGSPWLGRQVNQLGGGFGVLSYDMDFRMLAAMLGKYPGTDTNRVSLVQAYKQGNPLGVPDFRSQIATEWQRLSVDVVIVDSFSASFFGHDQNDAGATMAHYRDLKQFALTEVGAKVLIVIVHSTEANPLKVRGSTVHHDVADSIVGVTVDGQTQQRTVSMVKYRAAPGQHQMAPVIITPPDDVTHLIDLDPGAMSLANMTIPPSHAATMFADIPEPFEEPDTESDEEDDL